MIAFFVNFSLAGSDAGVAVAMAVAVSPFGFDSFINCYQEARNPKADWQLAFLEFAVSRFKSVFFFLLSHALWYHFLQVFHILGRSTVMLHIGAFARDVSGKE